MTIIQATKYHLNHLVPLFDAYRVFYKQPSNLDAAQHFLKERFKNKDSIIYMAFDEDKAVGFMQLYPLFSSVSMKPMYLLNDLFIDPDYRNQHIGTTFIEKAKSVCVDKKYKGLAIQTEAHNPAQNLYMNLGFKKDTDLHFFWTNK